MKTPTDKWLVQERAEAMAKVHLLRRDDLRLSTATAAGLNFVVRIVKDNAAPPLSFGIVLRATIPARTVQQANKALTPTLRALSAADAFSYPVCLFYFTMHGNGSFVTWVAEPVVEPAGRPALILRGQADCEILNPVSLDRLVERVESWYDAFYATVGRHTEGNGMNGGVKVWNRILQAEAEYYAAHGEQPKTLKLPVRLASELAQLGPERLGDLSARILKDGIRTLENEQLFGMRVQLVRDAEEIAVE
jgi:hypothetical protein